MYSLLPKERDFCIQNLCILLVVSTVQYSPTPPEEERRFGFLKELLELRKHNLEVEWDDHV